MQTTSSIHTTPALTPEACQAARLARDSRFDGLFYTAVLSTGIYCRPTCPARAPREDNVRYFASAAACAAEGYRPCLRCRPDAAPGYSPANAQVTRAIALLEQGLSLTDIAAELGITDRHLRNVFAESLGVGPKEYQIYRRCLLAKQLLHETPMPITDIALACGFQSVRRFNDAFKRRLALTPSEVRRSAQDRVTSHGITLFLSYRPPYAWSSVQAFLAKRQVEGLERVTEASYSRSLSVPGGGWFDAVHEPSRHGFRVTFTLADPSRLSAAVAMVRRILDLDANSLAIGRALRAAFKGSSSAPALTEGMRVPQFCSAFEAGVRAILGQQVSVAAARKMTETLVHTLGETRPLGEGGGHYHLFPAPAQVAADELLFLGMPASRRASLRALAACCSEFPELDVARWLAIKGIGPWTVSYAQMRGAQHTDIWLAGDLGIKHALAQWPQISPDVAAPWRSYLTLQLWELLV
ncbi:Ada metal-binding domain-containing protein [Simiduia agarivorans]|uniref:DNA-3-methyladenine glycosylase II n=1 Tax=Simiduia agarivorans (strain DSM 21679 / JCM 13881 / BCRC 17597 / SA1) TaxID=1117647 RepID=K4KII2_SIMAS|nr:Ada metal-binding domain-containing protein [Simiduia agarivorans]AFU98010.1 transcriptional regulator Ada / DNA-3-methyladenine glycosylase II / DNA-O6-methylguanine--protein-cysteine S-methyltransferase [Simiduia agarivorans SA1 = DSM 21679]